MCCYLCLPLKRIATDGDNTVAKMLHFIGLFRHLSCVFVGRFVLVDNLTDANHDVQLQSFIKIPG